MKEILPLLVTPSELSQAISTPDVIVVDVRGKVAYMEDHIPSAVNLESSLLFSKDQAPGLLPNLDVLSWMLSAIGLTPDTHVVAYDDGPGAGACRLLWTLYALGHDRLSLLNGGYDAWDYDGETVEEYRKAIKPSHYQIEEPRRGIVSKEEVLEKLGDENVVLLDTRSPNEYRGKVVRAERGGRIPGAVNINWLENIDPTRQNRLAEDAAIVARLNENGVTPDKEIIVYCQTHHRSSHTFITLKHLGFENVSAYSGSWSQWGNDPSLPIEIDTPEN